MRYRIEAWSDHSAESIWASEIIGSTAGDGSVIGDRSPGDPYLRAIGSEFNLTFVRRARTFAFAIDQLQRATWLADGPIYHVFLDRFCPGDGRAFADPETPMGFYGGSIRGVLEQLDHISALGAAAIWLSPLFPSPSHHGYDATDLARVEPRLGTVDDLQALIDATHACGMRLIFDFVANHISDEHPYFQDALTNPASPYRDWFTFTSYPDTYVSFFGVRTMPQLNCDHPEARGFVIDSALRWLERGVDGFRLDYTIGPSHAFWTEFRAAARAVRPDCALLGEAVDTAEMLHSYVGRMDGCLDFLLLQAFRRFFAFDELSVSGFDSFLRRHFAAFPPEFAMPSFLDNHDMNRFLWVVRGDIRRLRLAALCQYTLPHTPIVYYGTEVGLSQQRDVRHRDGSGHPEESRLPMLWGEAQNQSLYDFYCRLGALRRNAAAAWAGARETLFIDDVRSHYLCRCGLGPEQRLVALNRSPASGRIMLPPGDWIVELASDDAATGASSVALPAYAGVVLRRTDSQLR